MRRIHVHCAMAITLLSLPALAAPPDPIELMEKIGLSKKQRKAVIDGEVVVHSLSQIVSKKEVTAVSILRVPIPVDQIMDRLAGGKSIEKGLHVLAMGQPPVIPDGTGWEKAVFSESEQAEVDAILDATPGLDLNLSSEEFAQLSRRLANVPKADRRVAVSDAYREVLEKRFYAYVASGLDGVAAYDRGGGKSTSAADGIRGVWEVETVVATWFPEFGRAVSRYPKDQPPGMVNQFFWVKEQFESKFSSRPAFSLEHQAWMQGEGYAIVSVRQFFISHTINGQQGLGLALPYEDDSIIFNSMSVSSDLIERYVRMIALPIGQKIQRSEMKKLYKAMRGDAPTGR